MFERSPALLKKNLKDLNRKDLILKTIKNCIRKGKIFKGILKINKTDPSTTLRRFKIK